MKLLEMCICFDPQDLFVGLYPNKITQMERGKKCIKNFDRIDHNSDKLEIT